MGVRAMEARSRRKGQLVPRGAEDVLPQKAQDDNMGEYPKHHQRVRLFLLSPRPLPLLTDDRWDDRLDQNGKDRDHAKVYVGSFKHAMFLTRYTGSYGLDDKEWRSNDWYFIPVRDNELIDGLTLPGKTS